MLEFRIMVVSEALVIFAKQPDPLHTKLRLTPPLSRESATELYGCFLADVLAVSRQLQGIDCIICSHPPESRSYFASLAPDFRWMAQTGRDLGERMSRALAELFSEDYQRVVLIGSDLPQLSVQTLQQGFQALQQGAQVVLGPSADGGYYLVGLTQPRPELFDLPMSTPFVFQQTLERAGRLDLRLALLEENFDIDTTVDLQELKRLLLSDLDIPAQHTRHWLASQPLGFLGDDL